MKRQTSVLYRCIPYTHTKQDSKLCSFIQKAALFCFLNTQNGKLLSKITTVIMMQKCRVLISGWSVFKIIIKK